MVTHTRVEIFAAAGHAETIVRAIMDAVYFGAIGDCIVVLLPVEPIYRIYNRTEMPPDDF